MTEEKYLIIKNAVKDLLKDSTDKYHNFDHLLRVEKNALLISDALNKKTDIDEFLLRVCCLVHDLTYIKHKSNLYVYFFEGPIAKKIVSDFLLSYEVSDEEKSIILNAVYKHTLSFPFRLLDKKEDYYTQILEDADTFDYFSEERTKTLLGQKRGKLLQKLTTVVVNLITMWGRKNIRFFLNYPNISLKILS